MLRDASKYVGLHLIQSVRRDLKLGSVLWFVESWRLLGKTLQKNVADFLVENDPHCPHAIPHLCNPIVVVDVVASIVNEVRIFVCEDGLVSPSWRDVVKDLQVCAVQLQRPRKDELRV